MHLIFLADKYQASPPTVEVVEGVAEQCLALWLGVSRQLDLRHRVLVAWSRVEVALLARQADLTVERRTQANPNVSRRWTLDSASHHSPLRSSFALPEPGAEA